MRAPTRRMRGEVTATAAHRTCADTLAAMNTGAMAVAAAPDADAATLARELTSVRRRGLDDLDLVTPQQPAIDVAELERLARRYTGQLRGGRIAPIRRLLSAALTSWERDRREDAQVVRRLFFSEAGETPGRGRPADLLKQAQELSGLTVAQFDKRRTFLLRQFAEFLIEFVDAAEATAEAAVPPESTTMPAATAPVVTVPPRRSWRRRRLLISGLSLLVAAVAVALSVLALQGDSSARPTTIVGQVTCLSGAPAVAVWIQTMHGTDSGWASTHRTAPNMATFEYVLPRNAHYAVHVGCGGTNTKWASDNRSSYVPLTVRSFVCQDRPTPPPARSYGTCSPA